MLAEHAPRILDWLLVGSLRIGVVFLPIWLLDRGLRHRGARTRVLLWRTALVLFALIGFVPASLPHAPEAPLRIARVRELTAPHPIAAAPLAPGTDSIEFESAVVSAVLSTVAPAEGPRSRWVEGWIALWFLGSLAHGMRLVLGSLALRNRVRASRAFTDPGGLEDLRQVARRLGGRANISVRTTPWSGAPALVGLLHPVVLLPESATAWCPSKRRAVLTHELMHLRNRDPWATRFAELLRIVFWFHPAVLHALRENARAQELRCDHEVVRSGVDALGYAESLIEIARETPRHDACSLAFARVSRLEERVRRVLDMSREARSDRRGSGHLLAVLSCGGLLALVGATGAWAVQVAESPPFAVRGSGAGAVAEQSLDADLEHFVVRLNAGARVFPTTKDPWMRVEAPTPAEARAFLDRLVLERSGRSVSVLDPNSGKTPHVTLELHLPPASHLDLSTANSNVAIRWPRLRGPMSVGSGRGDIRIDLEEPGSRGLLTVQAGLGDISLSLPDRSSGAFEVHCPLGQVNRDLRTVSDDPAFEAQLLSSLGNIRVHDSP